MDPSQLSGPPRFRFRKLDHPGDLGVVAAGVLGAEASSLHGSFGDRMDETAGAVHELGLVKEGSGTVAEICGLLQRGTLVPEDLVNDGTGWQSLDDYPAFDDACEPFRQRSRWSYRLALAAAVVVAFLLALARIAALAARDR